MTRLPVLLGSALLIAACSTQPPPTGPGTATLNIGATYTACHSIGGCEYAANLAGAGVAADVTLVAAPAEHVLAIGAGMPHELRDGAYDLTFTSKLMSDAIVDGQPRDFSIGASCGTTFVVGSGRSTVNVRVTFMPDRCNIEIATTE